MSVGDRDLLRSAAILKLSFIMKQLEHTPGFLFIYRGTLRDLHVTEEAVDAYIAQHRDELEASITERDPHVRRTAD